MEKYIKQETQISILIKDTITNETKELQILFSGDYLSYLADLISDSFKLNSMCCFTCRVPVTDYENSNKIIINIHKFSEYDQDIELFTHKLILLLISLEKMNIKFLLDIIYDKN